MIEFITSPLRSRFDQWQRNASMRVQIVGTITVVATLVAAITAASMIFSQYTISRNAQLEDLRTQAKMISATVEAAVVFDDPSSATEILNTLKASPTVVSSRVIRPDGSVLASYASIGNQQKWRRIVTATENIQNNGMRIGTLEVRSHLGRLQTALIYYSLLVFTLLLFSVLALRFLFDRALIRLAAPLQQVLHTMRRVRNTNDYSQRCGIEGHNEIATLAQNFDRMLAQIENRNADLATELEARRAAQEQLTYLAHYDTLTALPNRHAFNECLKLIGAESRPMAVMMLDVDQFKVVNDTLGHYAGDILLKGIADRLRSAASSDGANTEIYRISGDEFAVVVVGEFPQRRACDLANRIMDAMNAPFLLFSQPSFASVSLGIAAFPEDADDPHTLIRHADIAMYAAKAKGRKTWCAFEVTMNERVTHRLYIEGELRKALANDQLFLVYEPQINLHTGKVVAVEALVRWQHPELGRISPAEFIPIAEESGLIQLLGEWVFRRACLEGRAVLDRKTVAPTFKIGVNLSPRQLADPKLLEMLITALRDTNMPIGNIELEITESALVEDTETMAERMRAVVDLGFTFAMDDFGVGSTSLAHLKHLPVSKVKIDRGFIKDLPDDQDDAAIATAIIDMSHRLNKPVLAEGIENTRQLRYLKENGCDLVQGFMFGREMSLFDALNINPNEKMATISTVMA